MKIPFSAIVLLCASVVQAHLAFDEGAALQTGFFTIKRAPATVSWSGEIDPLSRVNYETNTVSHRSAYGRVNGPSTVTGSIDGHAVPVNVVATADTVWTNQWRASLELTPGPHQLSVSATLPNGLYSTNAAIWVTNGAAYESTTSTFDGAGTVTQRVWKSPGGATNRTQTLTWDGRGRLRKLVERDSANSGQDWSAIYDPFGRRLQTTQIVVTNGVALTNQPIVVSHYFDPLFEFLELGVTEGGRTTWKLMGPDMDERYGGQNGTGGLEAIVPGPALFCPVVGDAFGNVLAVYDGNHGGLVWSSNRVAGYGGIPGYRPLTAGTGGGQISLAGETAWRNRMTESIGYVWMGANWYDPVNQQWLAFDEQGHANLTSIGGHNASDGNPIGFHWDPDGRYGKIAWNTAIGSVRDIGQMASTLNALSDPTNPHYLEANTQLALQVAIDYSNAGEGWDGTRNAVNRFNPLRAPFEATSGMHLMEGPQLGVSLTWDESAVAWANTVSLVASLGTGAPGTVNAVSADLRAVGTSLTRFGAQLDSIAPRLNPANYSFNTGRLYSGLPLPEYVQPYDVGTYGELQGRSLVGDGLSLDHQPSNASNLRSAEEELGRSLTPAERAEIHNQGTAVAVPQRWHQSESLTYGGRNNAAQIQADALNPQAAALRDSQAMIEGASAADRAAAEAAAAQIRQRVGGK